MSAGVHLRYVLRLALTNTWWCSALGVPEEIGAALLPGAHDGWPHHPLSYAEVPVTTTLHTAALMHPALHAQLPVSPHVCFSATLRIGLFSLRRRGLKKETAVFCILRTVFI